MSDGVDKKLLVLCPSRGRPVLLMDFIKNFRATTDNSHTDLLILLDRDDSCLGQYLWNMPRDIRFQIYDRTGDWTYTTEIINRAFQANSNYSFYSVTNDDMEYITHGWDKTLSVAGMVSCGKEINAFNKHGWFAKNSIVHKGGFPYTSVLDGDLVREVGWLQYPKSKCAIGDSVWYHIALKLGIFRPNPAVEYRHKTHYHNDGEYDETAQRTDAYKHLDTDGAELLRWKKEDLENLVNRIKTLKNKGEKSCHTEQVEACI